MERPERDDKLARAFLDLTDTLVEGFRLVDFLIALTDHATELLDVDAAGVLMVDVHGRLVDVTASTTAAHQLEEIQMEFDEGPGRDSCLHSRLVGPVYLPGERALERWPHFTKAARAAGFVTVAAVPLHLRDEVVGALNLFHSRFGGLHVADLRLGQALADAATIGILHQRLSSDRGEQIGQLHTALNSRVVIEQAKGALGARLRIPPAEAFQRLRTYARAHNRSLTELSMQVVEGAAGDELFTDLDDAPHTD